VTVVLVARVHDDDWRQSSRGAFGELEEGCRRAQGGARLENMVKLADEFTKTSQKQPVTMRYNRHNMRFGKGLTDRIDTVKAFDSWLEALHSSHSAR
jgi:hypothetical protein